MGWHAIVPHGAQKVVPIAALANPCFPVLTAGKIQGPEQSQQGILPYIPMLTGIILFQSR